MIGLSVLAALATFLVGGSSSAEPPYSRPWGPPYGVALEDENGNSLRSFHHDGETFVLGYVGGRYRIRISNHSGERVEAVLSVDGRDAISGRVGDYGEQRGYIVPPYGSVVVDGFRQSLDRIARFRFSDPSSSYSSKMGTPENVGVVGVAFFRERPWPRRAYTAPRDETWEYRRHAERYGDDGTWRRAPSGASPSPSSPKTPDASPGAGAAQKRSSAAADEASGAYRRDAPWRREYGDEERPSRGRLGTEYGESGFSPVSEVPFQRLSPAHPDTVLTVRYDDAEGLRARGIEVYPRPYWPTPEPPQAFPRNRFAPPPPY